MSGSYARQIGTAYPGLLLVLIDQSKSMEGEKARRAAEAVNNVIEEILNRSMDIESIKRRCFVGVVGYGDGGAAPVVGGAHRRRC